MVVPLPYNGRWHRAKLYSDEPPLSTDKPLSWHPARPAERLHAGETCPLARLVVGFRGCVPHEEDAAKLYALTVLNGSVLTRPRGTLSPNAVLSQTEPHPICRGCEVVDRRPLCGRGRASEGRMCLSATVHGK
jgi:hypothetical protein